MKRQEVVRTSFCLIAALCMSVTAARTARAGEPTSKQKPAAPAKPTAGTAYGDLIIGEPVVYKNLSIFPVSSKIAKNEDRFITLDEGLRSGKVKVVEVGADNETAPAAQQRRANQQQTARRGQPPQQNNVAPQPMPQRQQPVQQDNAPILVPQSLGAVSDSAEVNRLMVINNSGKPLYLMPGEVISGGKQDRTIGQELVIQSTNKPVPIEVFCVEHGRWRGRGADDTAALIVAANTYNRLTTARDTEITSQQRQEISEKAKKGEFAGSVGQLGKGARIAVQGDKDQGKVWDKVAENNRKSGAQTASGNFTANYAQKDVTEKLKPYIEACGKPVLQNPQVVGVVVAINGKVESVDIFESTPLFTKLYDKLLKSFALDAANAADPKAKIVACPTSECVKFLKEAEKTPVAKSEVNADLKAVRRESPSIITFTTGEAAAADAKVDFRLFNGGAIHTGGFKK